jgi:Gas vesicle protein
VSAVPGWQEDAWGQEEHWHAGGDASLADLLDRLLGSGVVLGGDITLAIADVDLVHISLRALIASVDAVLPARPQIEDLERGELT